MVREIEPLHATRCLPIASSVITTTDFGVELHRLPALIPLSTASLARRSPRSRQRPFFHQSRILISPAAQRLFTFTLSSTTPTFDLGSVVRSRLQLLSRHLVDLPASFARSEIIQNYRPHKQIVSKLCPASPLVSLRAVLTVECCEQDSLTSRKTQHGVPGTASWRPRLLQLYVITSKHRHRQSRDFPPASTHCLAVFSRFCRKSMPASHSIWFPINCSPPVPLLPYMFITRCDHQCAPAYAPLDTQENC